MLHTRGARLRRFPPSENDCFAVYKLQETTTKMPPSYVTSILITKLTFAMFLLNLSTLSTAIFLFVSLVLSLLCERSTGVFQFFFFPVFVIRR